MSGVLKKGDGVMISCDDRTVAGTVVIASPNGRSLMLAFEAMLHGHVGMMPVLQAEDGTYRSLIGNHAINIERLQ